MKLGIVTTYDTKKGLGSIITPEGNEVLFTLSAGRNMAISDDAVTPVFGRNRQPDTYALKTPEAGDPIAFVTNDDGTISLWGYAQHFVDLAERRYGTSFRSQPERTPVLSN